MNKNYKNAMDKIKLEESEKEKAKALFHEMDNVKEKPIRARRLLKPTVAIAAILVLVFAVNAILPTVQSNNPSCTLTENSVTLTAYAKELTKTEKVYSDDYASTSSILCGTDDGGISFAFEFPVECKGENIDTITYKINNGAFQISNQKGNSVVVAGEEITEELNVPSSSKRGTTASENVTDVAGETAISGVDSPDTSIENKEKEDLVFEFEEYKSFTVNYENQTNDTTCINVVDSSDIWSNEKVKQYKALNYDISGSSVEEEKEVCDFLTKDLGITCTVTYKDGSTETKNIVVTNDIVTLSDVIEDERSAGKEHTKLVVKCFSVK